MSEFHVWGPEFPCRRENETFWSYIAQSWPVPATYTSFIIEIQGADILFIKMIIYMLCHLSLSSTQPKAMPFFLLKQSSCSTITKQVLMVNNTV
jgi:hypothetical protein